MKEYVCDLCPSKFDTFQSKANHVRWEHLDNSGFSLKMKEANLRTAEEKFGKIIEEEVKCSNPKCSIFVLIKYRKERKKDKYHCSRKCANSRGPMSNETRDKISKKLSLEKKVNVCLYCNENFYIEKKMSKGQKFCSSTCRSKSKIKIDDSLQNYRRRASFNFNLSDFHEEFNFTLVEKYGWYKASNHGNNLNGVSRDHMVSVRFGFDNKINPEIIGHPANCQLMVHNENSSKNSECSISLDELLNRIKKWDIKYKK
jgi:hypothetical protein